MHIIHRVCIVAATVVLLGAGCDASTSSSGSSVSSAPIATPPEPTPPPPAPGVPPPPATRTETRTVTGSVGPVTIRAEETVTTNCSDDACFQKAFATCTSGATLTSDVGFASYHYRIVGSRNGGCAMETYYPTNPNPAWVNKKMTCTYNNRGSFEDAAQAMLNDLSTCSGPLAEILKNL